MKYMQRFLMDGLGNPPVNHDYHTNRAQIHHDKNEKANSKSKNSTFHFYFNKSFKLSDLPPPTCFRMARAFSCSLLIFPFSCF
mmetsp:Transcript_6780/g.11196  ORF Transcript_6780/g.11196 Transcript_6780/m.11196 type:complete len:83 (-) Transcript_6780:4007-4255(-)